MRWIHGIAPEHAAWTNDANRRFHFLHRANLHGRCVRPKKLIIADVERVARVSSRMACGNIQSIESAGLPLGLFEEASYDEVTVNAQSQDLFVFFSDGIIDALSPSGEQFGRKRLEAVVKEHSAEDSKEIVQVIFDAVVAHRQRRATFDDETVLAVKVK